MRVKRLKMQSFRGIGDLTLDFPTDEPTVFIGINGVGKSSILDCIAILLFPYINLITSEVKNIRTHNYKNFTKEKKVEDLFSQFFSTAEVKNGLTETHIEITAFLNKKQEVAWSLSNLIRDSYYTALKKIRDELNSQDHIPLAIYYPVNRAVFDITLEISEQVSFNQLNSYKSALAGVQIGFTSFFQWFRGLEDLENEKRLDDPIYRDRRLQAVRGAIYSLLPDFSKLRVRRSPLRMTVEKQDQELILNQLSDGEKCLLAMVGDLARRLALANPNLENPLEGAGVVLIDEIELHLHPEWQRKIMPALTRTFPNCQFIVTTHSPQVLSQVKPESIFILERTEEGEVIAKRPDSSFGRDSNRILEDLMGVSERPQKIKERILELFRVIDAGNLDLAKQLRQQIAEEIGLDDPELVKAGVSIRRREILKK